MPNWSNVMYVLSHSDARVRPDGILATGAAIIRARRAHASARGPSRGFTIVEMTVVLVIVALVVGAILLGGELFAHAGIRATVGQVEQHNSAVRTFQSKYGGLPGDLHVSDADAVGLFTLTGGSAGEAGLGDGNGLVETPTGEARGQGETLVFWRHLVEAGLIEGSFGAAGNSQIIAATGQPAGNVQDVGWSLPPARIGRGNFIVVYATGEANALEINGITTIIAGTGAYAASNPQLTPYEARTMDAKLDDGYPHSGTVVLRGPDAGGTLNQAEDGDDGMSFTVSIGCREDSGGQMVYRMADTTPMCALRVTLR